MPKEELFENTEDILRKYYDRSRQLTIKILGAKMNADLKKKLYIQPEGGWKDSWDSNTRKGEEKKQIKIN